MQRWIAALLALFCFVRSSLGVTEVLTSARDKSTRCSGVFQQSDILGGDAASIQVSMESARTDVSLVVYAYEDRDRIGYTPEGQVNVQYLCDTTAVSDGACSTAQIGQFIVNAENRTAGPEILTAVFKFRSDSRLGPQRLVYDVNLTGYYCVAAISTTDDWDDGSQFSATVRFRNPYGELPAVDYRKLPFYGVMSMLWLAVGTIWLVLSLLHWREILPVQNMLSWIILIILIENAFTFGFWENYNANGAQSSLLLVLSVVLSAGRNTISLFILLVVSLGYGVVKPTLGSTMQRCIGLAWVHFVVGNLYQAGQMMGAEVSLFSVLLFVLPLSLTLTTFYSWTIAALNQTIKTLEIRRQVIKLGMYRALFWLTVGAIVVLGMYFVGTVIFFRNHTDPSWLPQHWKDRWFWTEGFLNLEYAVVFWSMLFLWRPTSNNSRYGLLLPTSDDPGEEDPEVGLGVGLGYTNAAKREARPGRDSDDGRESTGDGETAQDVLAWAEKHLPPAEDGAEETGAEPGDDDVEAKLIKAEESKVQ